MVIFANILLFIWSSKNCDIIYLKKKLKRIIGPDKLEEEAIRNLIFICMKQQCILRMERLVGLLIDENNEADKTELRIQNWTDALKKEI